MSVEGREWVQPKLEITPSFEEARDLAEPNSIIPIFCTIPADLDTPVGAYLKLSGPINPSFLLESVEGGEHIGRYSYIGFNPKETIEIPPDSSEDPLEIIQQRLTRKVISIPELPPFHGGYVGYLGYECVRRYERSVDAPRNDPLGVPDAIFFKIDDVVAFDHLRHTMKIITHLSVDKLDEVEEQYEAAAERVKKTAEWLHNPVPFFYEGKKSDKAPIKTRTNMKQKEYEQMVRRIVEYIHAGDNIQTVLSLRLSRETPVHPFAVFRKLRTINPSPFMFYINFGKDFQLVGASPELLVKVDNDEVSTWPLAGTRPRGKTQEEDLAFEKELLSDPKERAEHIMLLDLGRNDIGRVAQYGSLKVPRRMEVVRYSNVMHMESQVQGKLNREKFKPIEALRACFPAGTVSGGPKVRAMERIAELEDDRRGPYAGGVGYVDFKGDLEMAITIRTIEFIDGVAHVQAGAGIVADSIPENEYNECLNKAKALILAIEAAEKDIE